MRSWFAVPLWKRTLLALILGLAVGSTWPTAASYVAWLGEIFVRLIRMVVIPLVLVTITTGIASLGSVRKLGSIGVRAIGLFVTLGAIAACVGVSLGVIVQPGRGAHFVQSASAGLQANTSLGEQLLEIIPTNPVAAMANGDMLAIIFFCLVAGVSVISAGTAVQPIKVLLAAATAVVFKMVMGVMEVAPFGVFSLVATAVGKTDSLIFANVALLAASVLCGSVIEVLIVHGALIRLGARLPFGCFLKGAADALLVSFSTGSSSATLPVAMNVSERHFGVSKAVCSTILPLGASIGRDGTAMYVGLLCVFSAQAFGLSLHLHDYARIVMATTLVALGTAPVPSASLFMLAAVMSVIGVSGEHTALIVGLVLPFDSLFNMVRTVPNATCNLGVAVTAARLEGEIDLARWSRGAGEL